MPYPLTLTNQRLNVAEQQYAVGKKVRLTNITSCIGVAGRRPDGRVVAVHLVIVGADGDAFDEDTANRAADLLQECEEVMIVGPYTIWQDNVGPAYGVLTTRLDPHEVFIDEPRGLQFSVSYGRLRYRVGGGRFCSCFG